jgi:hypothetical protein
MTDKQYIERWKKFVKMVLESTSIVKDEPDEDRYERKSYLEANPEEWFRYYFPRFAYAPPAQFHKEATLRVLGNNEWCEVRIWSRDLAKSTRTMMEVLYLTLVGHTPVHGASVTSPAGISGTIPPVAGVSSASSSPGEASPDPPDNTAERPKKYVLLISNSLDNATRLLMPYKVNLQYNKRIIQDYGLQESAVKWQADEFVTNGGVAFRALGAGQSPRGARNDEARPDILLFDDIDTDADCLNPEIITHRWRWIEEAAIGTRSVSQPTTIIFCGNRIAADCCIQRATKIADHVDERNIRDESGRSVWREKNSEVDIDRVLSQKSFAAIQKEYFNNPISEGSVFKQMAYKPARPLSDYQLLVCYTDPSYKNTNDCKATVLVGKWKTEFHVIKCYLDKATTAQMIEWYYNIMNLVDGNTCYYYMEELFMQDVLMKEVSDAGRRNGRPIPIRGDTRRKPDKFMRVESLLEPLNRNGDLYLNEMERHNPHMERLAEQFIALAPGSRTHDDGPDAVEGAIWIINQKLDAKTKTFTSFARMENDKRY